MDKNGEVVITGRARDMIIRGGYNIDPQIAEEALHRHPDVRIAAAVGQPDAHAGALPVAYVQLKPAPVVTAEALNTFAKCEVSEQAAAPVEVIDLDDVSKTGFDKIFKPALRTDAIRRIFERTLGAIGGAVACEVSVENDTTVGIIARVSLNVAKPAFIAQARAWLDAFTVKYELAA